MSQGNDFANYTAAASSEPPGAEEVWFVAVASDDIKQMNVDQLDEAFRLGVITADTAVWTEGMEAWAPLGQIADLDGSSEGSGSDSVGAAHAGQSHEERDARREPTPREAPATMPPTMSPFGMSSGGFASTLQSAQHSFVPGPNSISPVTSSYAPTAGRDSSKNGPVALNVDEDMPSIHHGRRFRPERWALAAAALVAVGVVGYNNMFSSSLASAGTQSTAAAAAPVASASVKSRGYDSADGVEAGEKLTAKASATEEVPAPTPAKSAEGASSAASATAASAKSLEGQSATAKSAAEDSSDDAPSASPSSKTKANEKEGLKGSFSKAFNKKASSAKAAKVKPRKAAMRATTKARATKGAKKPGVARSQSAFDPLNDSLP